MAKKITALGRLILKHRAAKQITQSQFAEACGLSRVQVARLETGTRGHGNITFAAMTGLAEALEMTTEQLAELIEKKK